jgi:endonuclease VIII-like 1
MPEISEIRIMSEYINKIASSVDHFVSMDKSPEKKSKTDLTLPFTKFQLEATSRGKELKIRFIDLDFKYEESQSKEMVLTMGMSSNWNYSNDTFTVPKHTHLMVLASNGGVLGLYDVRRFARWEWRDWNPDRSPDPVRDFENFKSYFLGKLSKYPKKAAFKKPIYETLLNQEYFNGIGNYLRAEILGRININPNTPTGDYIMQAGDEFFNILRRVSEESYVLGGGQFKDWYNQEDREGEKWKSFQEWMQFYFNKDRCIPLKDSNGRVFWMDKKWL